MITPRSPGSSASASRLLRLRAAPRPARTIIASTRSTDLDLSAPPTTDPEPRPEFLELVGRLSATYCPPLLTTEVVDASRAALVGRDGGPLDEVETLARSALDVRLAESGPRAADGHPQP